MSVDEAIISKVIIEESLKFLSEYTDVDVIIVGAGPSGMTAAYYLAKNGVKTLVIERRLSFGGGIGGGGMLLPKIVAARPSDEILREINCSFYEVRNGIFVMDPAELIAKLASASINAGARFLLGVTVEDVIYRENPLRIEGVVIQWSAITLSGLHVDPIALRSRAVIDATGHDAEVVRIVARKIPEAGLKEIPGEKSMYAPEGERFVFEKTGKILPGLYATGMAVTAVFNGPRMGPIFSSMLLSGRKIAEIVIRDLH